MVLNEIYRISNKSLHKDPIVEGGIWYIISTPDMPIFSAR
jgi:hypothetical protein